MRSVVVETNRRPRWSWHPVRVALRVWVADKGFAACCNRSKNEASAHAYSTAV